MTQDDYLGQFNSLGLSGVVWHYIYHRSSTCLLYPFLHFWLKKKVYFFLHCREDPVFLHSWLPQSLFLTTISFCPLQKKYILWLFLVLRMLMLCQCKWKDNQKIFSRIKHACAAGRIPAIRTLWQVYSSTFEVRLVYIKVTFQPLGHNFLFWPAWILHRY